jgi:hypothetical protein
MAGCEHHRLPTTSGQVHSDDSEASPPEGPDSRHTVSYMEHHPSFSCAVIRFTIAISTSDIPCKVDDLVALAALSFSHFGPISFLLHSF